MSEPPPHRPSPHRPSPHRPSPYGRLHDGSPFDGPVAAGQQEPAATTRSRRPLVAAAIGLVVLLAAVLVVGMVIESTLFGGAVLDRAAVERDVAAQFQQREGVAVTLTCPGEMTVVAGGSYRCAGTTATGEHVPIRILVTGTAPAAYSWTLR